MQIQEGTLSGESFINASSVHWKDVPFINVHTEKFYKPGRDYHILTHNNRSIDLNDIRSQTNSVLTGLRFVVVKGHLNLEARMTLFDYETGMLNLSISSSWVSSYEHVAQVQFVYFTVEFFQSD